LIFHSTTPQQLVVPTATATATAKQKKSSNLTVHIKRVIEVGCKSLFSFPCCCRRLLLLSLLFVIDSLQREKQVGKVFFIAFAESPSACLYCFTQ
jgi:hypothetical protein